MSGEADEAADCPIDFNTFVLSLSSTVLANLGNDDAPSSDPVQRALAEQTIDLLELLEEKTVGNLTGEEERLLGEVLAEIRTAYVKRASTTP